MKISHTFVICTKDRPEGVMEFITQISTLKDAHKCQTIVVENSLTNEPYNKLINFLEKKEKFGSVNIIKSNPGLPRARNEALKIVNSKFTHFFDDDIVLPYDFIPAIELAANVSPDVVGFSPYISVANPTDHKRILKKLNSFLLRILHKEGKLSKSGRAIWLQSPGRTIGTQWLPGCCMSYRTQSILGMKFDENLEKGPLGGYALGEDLVFSFELSKKGKLAAIGSITVTHKLAPNDRTNWAVMDEGIGRLRAYLLMHFPSEVKLLPVVTSLVLEGAYDLIRVKIIKNKKIGIEGRNFQRLFAFFAEYREPIMSQKKGTYEN
jgi:hypothetical protein